MTTELASAPTREAQYRAISFGEFVDLEMRADGDGREFEGIAVPWEVETDLDGYVHEIWTSGAFRHQERAANRVSVGKGHIPLGGILVGSLRELRNDGKGQYVRGRISNIPDGNDAITLMTDKALRELSVGFYRVAGGDEVTRRADGGPTIRMRKANLFEVALTPMGQYGDKAQVSGMREFGTAVANPATERERIVVGMRQVTVMVDGLTASVPFAGDLGDAVRNLLGPTSAQQHAAPAAVAEPEPIVDGFGDVPELPDVATLLPSAAV